MKDNWISIKVQVRGAFVEMVGAVLADQGCSGVVVEEQKLDTFTVPDNELDLTAEYNLNAYFDAEMDSQQLVADLKAVFREIPVFKTEALTITPGTVVRMEDWAEDWKQNFSTFRIGERLVVRPSWEKYPAQAGEAGIEIDPGMACGTGTHGTTQLCLEMIADLLDGSHPPTTILDVGTGSGILAIGAAALGCRKILANDIDPVACAVAKENVAKNKFDQYIRVIPEPLEQVAGQFDLIVANILAEENIRLKHTFMEHLQPGGWLVLSGILKEKEQLVCDGFADLPLALFPSRYADEWVCLLFRRAV